MRMLLILAVLVPAVLASLVGCHTTTGGDASIDAEAAHDPPLDADWERLFERVGPAIVQIYFDPGKERFAGLGVVVDPSGWILTDIHFTPNPPYFVLHQPEQIGTLHFFDQEGRRAEGVVHSWSDELKVSLYKVTDGTVFPHVEWSDEPVSVGQPVGAIQLSKYYETPDRGEPVVFRGRVTQSGLPYWFRTSCKFKAFAPHFSMDGALVGYTAAKPRGSDLYCTPAGMIREFWPLFLNGGNVDAFRLGQGIDYGRLGVRGENSERVDLELDIELPEPVRHAVSATVRIVANRDESTGKYQGGSGVIVSPDGLVATCGHFSELIPGTPLQIELPDGRTFRGQMLNQNMSSDIGLCRIMDKTNLPFVELGRTGLLEADDPCWIAGYPGDYTGRVPVIQATSMLISGVPWLNTIYTSPEGADLRGGMSGGGLFDAEGRLLGVLSGSGNAYGGRFSRVEALLRQWDYLEAGEAVEWQ